jgi:putative ABC transport system substrate-binding protein
MRSDASALGVRLTVFEARTPRELEPVFGRIAATPCDAVVVQGDTLFGVHVRTVADLAMRHRLVSASSLTGFAEAGGLIEYGPDRLEGHRRAAYFVDKLLKGARPSDLPMEQPTRFDLVINMTTAKALGLAIPQALAVQARLI